MNFLKTFSIFICLCIFSSYSHAQLTNSRGDFLGIAFFVNHYPASSLAVEEEFTRNSIFSPGISLYFESGFSNRLSWKFQSSASFMQDAFKRDVSSNQKKLLLETDFNLQAGLSRTSTVITPFVAAGLGFSVFKSKIGLYTPIGTGVRIKISQDVFINPEVQCRLPLNDYSARHFVYSVGISGSLKAKRRGKNLHRESVKISAPLVIGHLDSDRDGIVDSLDLCPSAPGTIQANGCPDRDGDGIKDSDDRCPDAFGFTRYVGCPVPDKDRDGVNDEEDKCPNVKGSTENLGCPQDRDSDGVIDIEDKCPDIPGVANQSGCPAIPESISALVDSLANRIYFETGRYALKPKSLRSLDKIATILIGDDKLKLTIEGHTDNIGSAEDNLFLSERRANSVLIYLASKGVKAERLRGVGFGAARPISDNSYAKGRALNRRVELKLSY